MFVSRVCGVEAGAEREATAKSALLENANGIMSLGMAGLNLL